LRPALSLLTALLGSACATAEAPVQPAPVVQVGPAPPAPSSDRADDWCDTRVFSLERAAGRPLSRLRDVATSTQLVTIARSSLAKSDCSSVGHHHLAFEIADADEAGARNAYVRLMLPVTGIAPPRAPVYLLGGSRVPAREVDLDSVCVRYRASVDVNAEWVVPLADETEAQRWRERVRTGLCGRAPAATPEVRASP
jgi:hypothetical protein